MNDFPTTIERPPADPHNLVQSFLFRTVRNAADLVHADGGTISATNLVSGENFDFSYGSGYRHSSVSADRPPTRIELTGAKKI